MQTDRCIDKFEIAHAQGFCEHVVEFFCPVSTSNLPSCIPSLNVNAALRVAQVRRYEAGTSRPTLDVIRSLAVAPGIRRLQPERRREITKSFFLVLCGIEFVLGKKYLLSRAEDCPNAHRPVGSTGAC